MLIWDGSMPERRRACTDDRLVLRVMEGGVSWKNSRVGHGHAIDAGLGIGCWYECICCWLAVVVRTDGQGEIFWYDVGVILALFLIVLNLPIIFAWTSGHIAAIMRKAMWLFCAKFGDEQFTNLFWGHLLSRYRDMVLAVLEEWLPFLI